MTKKLLPQRHVNRDFFVADILDATPRDDIASMEHPIFSLSMKPDLEIRHYEHNGNSLTVTPSILGLATIWDKDILIFCISQLIAGVNQGKEPSRKVEVSLYEVMVATNRNTGGKAYSQIEQALDRLAGTRLKTNIVTGDYPITRAFGLIDTYDVVHRTKNGRLSTVTITLSEWLYNAIVAKEVLGIHENYFRLASGIERKLYELCRKHCGHQASWKINLVLLHTKSGSRAPFKRFKFELKKIVEASHIPQYTLRISKDGESLLVRNRQKSLLSD